MPDHNSNNKLYTPSKTTNINSNQSGSGLSLNPLTISSGDKSSLFSMGKKLLNTESKKTNNDFFQEEEEETAFFGAAKLTDEQLKA